VTDVTRREQRRAMHHDEAQPKSHERHGPQMAAPWTVVLVLALCIRFGEGLAGASIRHP
jgi:hypothetical protein